MIAVVVVLGAGAVSAWLYARARRWPDALLIVVAALALAGLLRDFRTPAPPARAVAIDADAALIDIGNAAAVSIAGNGMNAARWRDLPARPLRWQAPAAGALHLDFPRSVAPGALFTLSARWPTRVGLRVQLLSENGKLLAESAPADQEAGAPMTLHWRAPVEEDLVLRARVLDAGGKLLAQGPLPLRVEVAAPLRVLARLESASFDASALRRLLESSHALLDWQVQLGAGVVHTHVPRAQFSDADLIVTDARWLEGHGGAERAGLLEQVKQGAGLLILGADAGQRAPLAELLQLELSEQAEGRSAGPLGMTRTGWRARTQGPWTAHGSLATRAYGAGRIGWLGVAGWHRHAIAEPHQLAAWWQDLLDQLALGRAQPFKGLDAQPLPLAGRRLEVCAHGATGTVSFPQLGQTLAWQRRADRADASCVAVWPLEAGWLRVQTGAGHANRIYVYARDDWGSWQASLEREATRRYAARTPSPALGRALPLPAWPFAGLFALSMLTLWGRERKR